MCLPPTPHTQQKDSIAGILVPIIHVLGSGDKRIAKGEHDGPRSKDDDEVDCDEGVFGLILEFLNYGRSTEFGQAGGNVVRECDDDAVVDGRGGVIVEHEDVHYEDAEDGIQDQGWDETDSHG